MKLRVDTAHLTADVFLFLAVSISTGGPPIFIVAEEETFVF
jgi:hypothetical protein